jgi:hypothetical protein
MGPGLQPVPVYRNGRALAFQDYTYAVTADIALVYTNTSATNIGVRGRNLFFTPNAEWAVNLPPETASKGVEIHIHNMAAIQGRDLRIRDDSGVSYLGRVEPGMSARCACNGTVWQVVVSGPVRPVGGRYELREDFAQRPAIVADIALEPSNKNFTLSGTNAVTASATVYGTGGIQLVTGAVANDQCLVSPSAGTQSSFGGTSWAPNGQPRWYGGWRGVSAAAATLRMCAGLKLTTVPDTTTDADQAVFFYDSVLTGNNDWWCAVRIAAALTLTDTGIAYAAASIYDMAIEIDAAGICRMYLNGLIVRTTTAMTAAAALIPVYGIMTFGAAGAKTGVIYPVTMSRIRV